MSREEFLQGLRAALSGTVPPSVVQENLRYYDDYIRTQTRSGRTERDVMDELGDPRLIARTIIDTTPGAAENAFEEYRGSFFGGSAGSSAGSGPGGGVYGGNVYGGASGGGDFDEDQSGRKGPTVHYYNLNKWYWKLLGIVVVIGIIVLVLAVLGGILTLVVPILPVIVLVMVIMWFVQGGSRR